MTKAPEERTLSDDDFDAQSLHFAAIGSVASEWAWFDQWVDFKTIEIAKVPAEVGICITSQISGSARKLDAYIAPARHLGAKKALPKLNAFANTTTALAERRKRVVHDPWVLDNDTRVAARLEATARKALRFLTVPVGTAEIAKLSVEIAEHINNFDAIHASVLAELSS